MADCLQMCNVKRFFGGVTCFHLCNIPSVQLNMADDLAVGAGSNLGVHGVTQEATAKPGPAF